MVKKGTDEVSNKVRKRGKKSNGRENDRAREIKVVKEKEKHRWSLRRGSKEDSSWQAVLAHNSTC